MLFLVRLVEIGASAGLNLRWDHYRYDDGGHGWGPPGSPVRLDGPWPDGPPPFEVEATVAERAGCDLSPLDATTGDGRLTLASYIWADQVDRLRASIRLLASLTGDRLPA